MKWTLYLSLVFLLFFAGCKDEKKALELAQKEKSLNQKEQELLEKEKTLQQKEEELAKKQLQLDSSLNKNLKDSGVYNAELVGRWSVRMNCTETTCPGSAIGDTKTEQWEMAYQDNLLTAKVFDNGKMVRTYSGIFNGSTVELAFQQIENTPATTNITVRLQQSSKNRLTGTREINREESCKIVYAVELVKL